jgi:hypothetical protein
MRPPIDRNLRTLLFNPFAIVAGGPALLFGVAAVLLAGLIGSSNSFHFDGVLDFHSLTPRASWIFFAEGIVDWLCVALVLLAIGRIVSRTPFRIIDLFGTQAMARWPSVLIASAASIPAFRRHGAHLTATLGTGHETPLNLSDRIIFGAVSMGILALVCWMTALLYHAYSVSCNIRGRKSVWTFTAGIVLAEGFSKIVLYWLNNLATR